MIATLSTLALLAAAPLSLDAQVPGLAQDPETPDEVREVYLDLARQFGTRQAPHLEMAPNNNALRYMPDEHVVQMSPRSYQVVQQLGDAAPAALAYLLGHELAHFYADHVFDRDYATDSLFADLRSTKVVRPKPGLGARMIELETQSDFLAGFKAYLAGYDALPVAPDVLRRIYAEFGWSTGEGEAVGSHPPLDDRVLILERVGESLERMIAGFEGGTRLLVVGAYPQAGRFFGRIAQNFPSREILSNAGVAKTMEALEIAGDNVAWVYPFEVDLETRLRGDRGGKGGFGLGGLTGADSVRVMRLLGEAKELFQKATIADPEYISGYVNLAAINALMGEPFNALGDAAKAERLATEQGEPVPAAHARVVRGIVMADCAADSGLPMCGDTEAVAALFESARAVAPRLATINLAILRDETSAGAMADAERIRCDEQPGGRCPEETIGGLGRDDAAAYLNEGGEFALEMDVPAPGGSSDEPTYVRVRKSDDVDVYLYGNQAMDFAIVLSTPDGYDGESGRGIRTGSAASAVAEGYGEPSRITAARQGEFWVYERNQIAFLVNEDGVVESWMIWTMWG